MLSSAPISLAMEMIVEEEIDLRPYVEALLQHWIWIMAAGVGTAVLAFIISSLLPPTYEATALVAVTSERERIQFDPRFETEAEQQALSAYPELAVSDELLQKTLDELEEIGRNIETVQQFRSSISAEAGSDPSLIRLTVSHQSATAAATIANVWAEQFVGWANEIYRDSNTTQLLFFEEQLAAAEAELAATEEALVGFQARNRGNIVDDRLTALHEVQVNYLADRQRLTFLMQDIAGLRAQLAARSDNAVVTVADQVAALNLQLRAFNAEENDSLGLQLQLAPDVSLTSSNRTDQLAYLDELVATLQTRLEEIEANLATLEPQILALQEEKQMLQAEETRLERNVSVADETYIALARKVDEVRITSQGQSNDLRLASRSAVPVDPVAPRRLVNTAVAGILGVLLTVFVILTRLWWSSTH
jgi:uncharacterized protein involved in exopolysaccharide biosynthesis